MRSILQFRSSEASRMPEINGKPYPRVSCFPSRLTTDGAMIIVLERIWEEQWRDKRSKRVRHNGRNRLMVVPIVLGGENRSGGLRIEDDVEDFRTRCYGAA
jgi:hypothetical protein